MHFDLYLILGWMIPQGTIRRGARCSTAKAFLNPTRGRPNLDIVVFAHATKVSSNEKNFILDLRSGIIYLFLLKSVTLKDALKWFL